jgi:ubiquinone/menaquinone biosynthesis C-methylase UbiE
VVLQIQVTMLDTKWYMLKEGKKKKREKETAECFFFYQRDGPQVTVEGLLVAAIPSSFKRRLRRC